MVKLLITDLDDTLYPWMQFFVPAFYAMAEEVSNITKEGLQTVLAQYKEVHQKIGSVEAPFATLQLPCVKSAFPDLTSEEQKKRLDPAFRKFNHERKHRMHLFPGVKETLEYIHNAGIKIVGYTESASENGVYRLGPKQLNIDSLFSKFYVSDSQSGQSAHKNIHSSKIVTVQGKKPNAEILKQIITNENVQTYEALYIGDSLTKDIFMAKQLGVTSVLFRGQDRFDSELYDKLVAITSWKPEDFEKEQAIREVCSRTGIIPDYTIFDFLELKEIVWKLDKETDYDCQ